MSTLTVWAQDGTPPSGCQVALWEAFLPDDPPAGWYSLPLEVHENRDSLRTDYLSWLHEVGVAKIRGTALVDRMAIRPGLSYWWMTIPADNSLESNSPAYVAVRLMALAALADRLGVTSVRIITSDRTFARLLREWAKSTGRIYETQLGPRPRLTRESIYRAFTFLAALRVVIGHAGIPGRVKNVSEGSPVGAGRTGICLVDYMAHFAPGAVDEGRFASNYWGPLVEMLDEIDEPVRWLHISADLASSGVVTRDDELVRQFNGNATRHTHDLLHRHLTWAILTRSCRDYLRVSWFGMTAGPRAQVFFDARSSTSLWQAFRNAYRDQFFGKTAMLNCLWLNILEESLGRMPKQRLGIYLFENQPWEMAFINVWRRHRHGDLIGVVHTTALFWSTRLFKDARDTWPCKGDHRLPWPDAVAVNGPLMRDACTNGGYPDLHVVEAEALRYLDVHARAVASPAPRGKRILICGEYSSDANDRLLQQFSTALDLVVSPCNVFLRPHPAGAAPKNLNPRILIDDEMSTMDALSASCVVICGTLSSVSVEAACLGIPTLLAVDPDVLRTSPAESLPGVDYSPTAQHLANVIDRLLAGRPSRLTNGQSVFHLDTALPRWRTLVSDRPHEAWNRSDS